SADPSHGYRARQSPRGGCEQIADARLSVRKEKRRRGAPPPLLDQRQRRELVEGRRGRKRPFERGGPVPPGIVAGHALPREGLRDGDEEDEEAGGGDVGARRGDEIPSGEGVRIVRIAA